jgi:hypothetical protein
MKKSLTLIATLALAAFLLPAAFAQQDQTASPSASSSSSTTPQAAPDQSASPAGAASQTSGDQGAASPSSPASSSPSSSAPVASPSTQASPSDQGSPSQGSTPPSTGDTGSAASAAAGQNSFSGTVVKAGDKYVLKTDQGSYQLDDQSKAQKYEGQQVKVNGSLDSTTSVLHVTDITPGSAQ